MKKDLVRRLRRALPRFLTQRLPREVKVVEIPETVAMRLNKKYRKRNKPANVLSFRYGKDYGEILICPEVIRKDAKTEGNTYKYQMTWMVLHGILHLAGLHHEKSRRAAKTAAKIEQEVLHKIFPSRS